MADKCRHKDCRIDAMADLIRIGNRLPNRFEECLRAAATVWFGEVRCRHIPRTPGVPLPPLKEDI